MQRLSLSLNQQYKIKSKTDVLGKIWGIFPKFINLSKI